MPQVCLRGRRQVLLCAAAEPIPSDYLASLGESFLALQASTFMSVALLPQPPSVSGMLVSAGALIVGAVMVGFQVAKEG